jgi:hypothetical protein
MLLRQHDKRGDEIGDLACAGIKKMAQVLADGFVMGN